MVAHERRAVGCNEIELPVVSPPKYFAHSSCDPLAQMVLSLRIACYSLGNFTFVAQSPHHRFRPPSAISLDLRD